MANRLKMAMVNAILTLKEHGWSIRRISRELGVDRETVKRHVSSSPKPASNPPIGLGMISKPATNPPTGSGTGSDPSSEHPPGPVSKCEPYRDIIANKIEQGLSRTRILQDLRLEHGYGGGYDSVKRFVRRLGSVEQPLPVRRLECRPGQEAQVDFGTGAPVIDPDGRRHRSHVFRITLSSSRSSYSESVSRQTTDDFIHCLENAFHHFGGVPETLVIDNLKAAVSKADWYDPEVNPKLQSFCKHYGTVILPTKPYTPRHKGKIERGIAYVQDNALKAKTFSSTAEQNAYLLWWETHIADTRIHGTTRKQVGKVFTEIEKPALLPLPLERFPMFTEAKRSVHRDGHIEVRHAYYSVPPEYVGREVWARWDGHLVRIYDSRMKQLTVHVQGPPGTFHTLPEHIHTKKISSVERGAAWLLQRAELIGPSASAWSQAMLKARGIQGIRVLVGLMSLAARHPAELIDQACQTALTHGAYRLRTIRELIKCGGGKEQKEFEFIDEHPIIRNMSDYGDIVRSAIR
jgi:transposase